MATPERPQIFTTVVDSREEEPSPRLCLVVIGDGIAGTHLLPDSGEVQIGRAHDSDIAVDHPSISRRHALLRLGPPLTIEDLGSANGTRLRERRLEPGERAPLSFGEVVDVGSALIIVQQRLAPLRARRMWAHGYFEARLDEECARAERLGHPFALARLRCRPGVAARVIEEALAEALRAVDVLGYYAPDEYEALLVDADGSEAEQVLERLGARLEAQGVGYRVGLACYPQDGRDPDSLVSAAAKRLSGESAGATPAGGVVTAPPGAIQQLNRLVERVAASMISVLILGETGVGKEVMAETVHKSSDRRDKPFLRLNCAALSETLLESELFGHERGAFTGAAQAKQGLLETADGGTVFLDEVGELPLSMQVKLLRVIEERKVLRVGGLKPRSIDVRFIAATNRDPEAEIARGTFRQDLYYRLNGVTLVIPPLRQRVDEIEPLARFFAGRAAAQLGEAGEPGFAAETLALLRQYGWPGNIRELKNVVERAVLLAAGGVILPEHLPVEKMHLIRSTPAGLPRGRSTSPPSLQAERPTPRPDAPAAAPARPPAASARSAPPAPAAARPAAPTNLKREIEAIERQRIIEALERCVGNQTEAARLLGISRRTLINRIEAFGIPRPRKHGGRAVGQTDGAGEDEA